MSEQPGSPAAAPVELHSRGYLTILLFAAALGIPLSLVAFAFLAAVHELQHLLWETLPHELGYDAPPAWWPILTIGLAGVVVALAVTRLPGHGGHVPVGGLGAGGTVPAALPGVLLAAGASLVGGAVLGPEAPLIALGGGLALVAVSRTRAAGDANAATILAAAGSAAAVSAIFGNPLVAPVIFLEVLGLARRPSLLVMLPILVSTGVGALLFTGLGRWTGLGIGALALPELEPVRLNPGEIVWAVPLATAIAGGTWALFAVGRGTARLATSHTVRTTIGAGLVAGVSACVYALVTGHTPADVAMSGQVTLVALAADPEAWSTGALVALILCKGAAYAVCLGTFRGGPVFPAICLGAASGILVASLVPGLTFLPGLAIGMAAGVAVIGLPVTGIVIVVLLLGDAASSQMPVVILAVVVATVVEELLSSSLRLARLEPGVLSTGLVP